MSNRRSLGSCKWAVLHAAFHWYRPTAGSLPHRTEGPRKWRGLDVGGILEGAPQLFYCFWKGSRTKDLGKTQPKCSATLLVRIRWWWKWKLTRRRTVKTVLTRWGCGGERLTFCSYFSFLCFKNGVTWSDRAANIRIVSFFKLESSHCFCVIHIF